MDITILDTQMTSKDGVFIPFMNLEDNNNTIYTAAYVSISASIVPTQVIYLKTDPEINISLSATTFSSLSDSAYIDTEDSKRLLAI